ncbi:EVE domain-containing protein [Alteromonas facilis]|uniref:EVE domain-containing protein n=1 Tax=Alteromonas facilis TaxID=2048004 RepID=UPI000C287939|nr:EVE domain-containing protein [Alteromonas facilis]
MNYWLFKTEPDVFGIDDLKRHPNKRATWDGVRNYQARNFLRDSVKVGDHVFIYHSSCKNIGITGLAKVTAVGLVDTTQFDPESKYFDPKATPDNPRWYMVEVEHVQTFKQVISLKSIKAMPEITELPLVKAGHRLSIMPVQTNEAEQLLAVAG